MARVCTRPASVSIHCPRVMAVGTPEYKISLEGYRDRLFINAALQVIAIQEAKIPAVVDG